MTQDELKNLRKSLNYTQEQMSAAMGISIRTLSRCETGKQKIGGAALKMCTCLQEHKEQSND